MRLSPQRITDSSLRSAVSVSKSSSWMPPDCSRRGEIARTVVGSENKRMQLRHLTGIKPAPKLRRFSFFLRAVNFSALDSFAQRLLDGCQNSVASFCILLVLLIIVQPEGRVDADKNQDKLREPTPSSREKRRPPISSCCAHGSGVINASTIISEATVVPCSRVHK